MVVIKWNVSQISQEVCGCDQVKCLRYHRKCVVVIKWNISVRYHMECVVVIKWNVCQISQKVCGCDPVESLSDITGSVWL